MDWNQVEGNWRQVRGNVKKQWGKLTDDDLTAIDGRREALEGKIQERYGYTKDRDCLQSRCGAGSDPDGKTQFIVENVEQAVHAVAHLDTIDRAVIRATFERRFSVEVMAAKYEDAYADVIARNDTRRLRIAATEDRKLARASASLHAVPSIPLADRA